LNPAALLRGNDAADGMAAGQDDAAMVNFGGGFGGLSRGREAGPFDQGAAAGWTPVCPGFLGEHSSALAANSFHTQELTRWGRHFSIQEAWEVPPDPAEGQDR
jgi:hypothetical protein